MIAFVALTIASLVFQGKEFISIGMLVPFVLFATMATLGFFIIKTFYQLAPAMDLKPLPHVGYAQ